MALKDGLKNPHRVVIKKKKKHSDKVKRERVKGDENSGGWKNHKLARVCQSGEFL